MNTSFDNLVNVEVEEAVLGACLLDQDAALEAVNRVTTEDFSGARISIFEGIETLVAEGTAVDNITVSNYLKSNGLLKSAGGASYLASLTDRLPDVANVSHYCTILAEQTTLREIKKIGQFICNEDVSDAQELLEETLNRLYNVRVADDSSEPKRVSKVASEVVADSIMLASGHLEDIGLPTNISGLDKIVTIKPGKQIILAGGPSTGKTSLALQIADLVADSGKNVLMFSLEMMADELATRLLARRTAAHFDAISKGRLESYYQTKLEQELTKIANMPLWICDNPDVSSTDIRAMARKHQLRHGLDMVVVDYLQLVTPPKGPKNRSRENEVSACSRGLKKLAMALPVPCLTLSQLSRKGQVDDKRPTLSDLRESGSIENDADIVVFIYRPDVRSPVAELMVSKNRNGPTGTIDMLFQGARYSFEEPPNGRETSPGFMEH